MLCTKIPDIDDLMHVYKPDHNNNLIYEDISETKYQDMFTDFKNKLTITEEQSIAIEKATRGQAANPCWKNARTYLLTASKFGAVAKRKKDTPPDNLLKQCRGYVFVSPLIKPLSWGRRKESKALRSYGMHHHKKCGSCVYVENRGLFINPKHPYLGTSIDGYIKCTKCGEGILEVKCPWTIRNLKPEDGVAVKNYDYCCVMDDENRLTLKSNHNYMYQIMGGMALYEVEWCDFVIWTRKGINVQRIPFNKDLWSEMLPKLEKFYLTGMIPELFSNRVKAGLPLYQ